MSYLRKKHVLNELEKNRPFYTYMDNGLAYMIALSIIGIYTVAYACSNDIPTSILTTTFNTLILVATLIYKNAKYYDTKRLIPTLMDKDIISIQKYKELVKHSNGFLTKDLLGKYITVTDHNADIVMNAEEIQLNLLLSNIMKGTYNRCPINNDTLIDFLISKFNHDNVGNIYWYAKQYELDTLVYACNRYCYDNRTELYFNMSKKI